MFAWQRHVEGEETTEVIDVNDAPAGLAPATTTALGATGVRSLGYRDAVKQARLLLAAQEAARKARRDARWSELALQLLHTDATLRSEAALYVRCYEIVRGDRTAALSTSECEALRDITHRVWARGTPSGIEEAATADADVSHTCSASGPGSTAVVSAAEGMAARSSSPAPVAACCDAPQLVAVECPRCLGAKGAHGGPNDGGDRGEVVWFACGQCEGDGTVLRCESCGEVQD